MAGKLYIVPTPVGNLEDMSVRAVQTLKDADLILAEDTRTSSVLMKHFQIDTHMIAHHKFNEHEAVGKVVERLKAGETIALVSDAGTPAISDPGEVLVAMCYEAGIEVTSLPIVTEIKEEQPEKAMPSIEVTLSGIMIELKEVQP